MREQPRYLMIHIKKNEVKLMFSLEGTHKKLLLDEYDAGDGWIYEQLSIQITFRMRCSLENHTVAYFRQ